MISISRSTFLLAAKQFMAQDDVRHYLNGVCIRPAEGGGIYIDATDGHRLLRIRDEIGSCERETILPLANITDSFFGLQERFSEGLEIADEDETYMVDRSIEIKSIADGWFVIDGTLAVPEIKHDNKGFPDFEKVIPEKPDTLVALPPVNMQYLQSFLDLGKWLNHERLSAQLSPTSENGPILINYTHALTGEVTGVLMPVKTDA